MKILLSKKMNSTKGFFSNITTRTKKAFAAASAFLFMGFNSLTAYASGDIGNSTFAKGFQKLLEDLSKWLIIIAPIATGLLLIYFFIRRGACDEHEQKNWNKRIVSALVCGTLAIGASLVIQMFEGYFT